MPGERYQAYHEEKARGGIGLTIFGGSSNVSRDSGSIYGQVHLGDDAVVPVLRGFAARVRRHGAGIMCQLTHMGRRTLWDSGDWLPTKAPSPIRDPAHHAAPYALSAREIARIVRDFAGAARRCREGELDGVEILATTHLLGQFLSPLSNCREDAYGGTVEARARFLLEVLEAAREATGDDFVIGVRFAPDEGNEDGLPLAEGLAVAALLGRHGIADYLNVNGVYGGTTMGLAENFPGMAFRSAPYVELARLRNAYSRECIEMAADTVVVDRGTLPVTEVFDALVAGSRNLGEVDHEALLALAPQPAHANPAGTWLLFRVGDAMAGRDIHAALLDANRLCRVL